MLLTALPAGSRELVPGVLWQTSDGVFLQASPAGWTELELDGAVELVYRAEDVRGEGLPPALAAAWHLRRAVLALAPPPIPPGPGTPSERAAEVADGAEDFVRACKAVDTLLRTVQRDIRAHRGSAAYVVRQAVPEHGDAAARLGMSASTLSDLLSGRSAKRAPATAGRPPR